MCTRPFYLVILAAVLCSHCTARDFTFTIRLAAGKSECFYEYIHEGALMEVEYQVSGHYFLGKTNGSLTTL